MERQTYKVLGFDVDKFSFEEAISFVAQNIENNKGLHIVTINPEMIAMAQKDETFAEVLKSADFVIPDGAGIKLALKLKGVCQEQIPGIDFAKKILGICNTKNYTVGLIGAKEEVIRKTVQNLKNEFQNLSINYIRNGYYTEKEEDKIIQELKETNLNFVLVALGAPKQELFITKCKKNMPQTTFIGVGGSFDVWAGIVQRAPEIYRKLGLEWLYRTLSQPQRIKRIYKTLPMFLIKVIIEAVQTNNIFFKRNKYDKTN